VRTITAIDHARTTGRQWGRQAGLGVHIARSFDRADGERVAWAMQAELHDLRTKLVAAHGEEVAKVWHDEAVASFEATLRQEMGL